MSLSALKPGLLHGVEKSCKVCILRLHLPGLDTHGEKGQVRYRKMFHTIQYLNIFNFLNQKSDNV